VYERDHWQEKKSFPIQLKKKIFPHPDQEKKFFSHPAQEKILLQFQVAGVECRRSND